MKKARRAAKPRKRKRRSYHFTRDDQRRVFAELAAWIRISQDAEFQAVLRDLQTDLELAVAEAVQP